MTPRPNRLGSDRILTGAIAVTSLLVLGAVLVPSMAQAQESGRSNQTFVEQDIETPRITATSQDAGKARRLSLSLGRSIVVELPRSAKEVFVGNPTIANAVVRTARKMYVIAMAEGTTTIFVNDADGRQIAAFDVNVAKERGNEIQALREVLRQALPNAVIEAKSVGENIVLSGEVDSLLEAQRALDIASNLVGIGLIGGGTATAASAVPGSTLLLPTVTGKVINGLRVRGKDQVMLKVTVAEVRRNTLKELGINLNGNWTIGGSVLRLSPTGPAPGDANISGTANSTGGSINGAIRALEEQGVFRTLSEPTLTAISGESAKFLAGGEVPIQTVNCDTTRCQTTVTFKPVGVSLAFTPVVLSEGRISMRVSTEVTERDATTVEDNNGSSLPAFLTRRTETTVELPSGGSMVTAGLIQNNSSTNFKGFPGLMKLPVIGALFRSREYRRNETELMIMVTPFIVKPVNSRDIPKPTDGFVDASDPASMFMGRVNRLYGAKGNRPGDGYRAPVGFIAD